MQPLVQWKKKISITCSDVSVALGIKHAMRMRYFWPVLLYCIFPHYLTTARFSKKKKYIDHKTCVFIFSTNLSETLVIMRKTQRGMIINVLAYSCKAPDILVIF